MRSEARHTNEPGYGGEGELDRDVAVACQFGQLSSPEVAELKRRIDVAAGRAPADTVIQNACVVNVFTAEIVEADIAIANGMIAALGESGEYEGANVFDAGGRLAAPGLIDAHMHLESTMVRPSEFARAAVPRGTLGVVADPHEIANVCGTHGIDFIARDCETVPMDTWLMIPSCVPATPFESSGSVLEAQDIKPLLHAASLNVRGLGEMMNYPGVIQAHPQVLEKLVAIDEGRQHVIDGHSPGVMGRDLVAYAAAGIHSDHECATVEEMHARLRLGLYVQIREGSACRNLLQLVPGITEANAHRCLFCTDDKHPEDIQEGGHIDNCLRMAIAAGVPPLVALRMATINVAECYGLQHVGALAPAYYANIVLLDSLEEFRPSQVFYRGKLVAEHGRALFAAARFRDKRVFSSVRIAPYEASDLRIALGAPHVQNAEQAAQTPASAEHTAQTPASAEYTAQTPASAEHAVQTPASAEHTAHAPVSAEHTAKARAHVMGLRPHSVETDNLICEVAVKDGYFAFEEGSDILKVAVFERHTAGGTVGLGLIKGFGLKQGAIASTVAHDSHNLIVIGDNDADMLAALAKIETTEGGITLISKGKVVASLPLPIAGLMSEKPIEEVAALVKEMCHCAYQMGVPAEVEPLMTLAFMALPVIPALKITDRGLFDVKAFDFVDIEAW